MGKRLPMASGLPNPTPAKRVFSPRNVPGLRFDPNFRIPDDVAENVRRACMEHYFKPDENGKPRFNQIQLFGLCTLSPELQSFLVTLSELMKPHLPSDVHALLFDPAYPEPSPHRQYSHSPSASPSSASPTPPPGAQRHRQAILNLYEPGEGITPHVDLENRYGDGIIGVSLGSGCVMNFRHDLRGQQDLYLPKNSVIVMSDDARFLWQHGIEGREVDLVEGEQPALSNVSDRGRGRGGRYYRVAFKPKPVLIRRETRLSITFRWLLPQAEPDPPDKDCDGEADLFEGEDDEDEVPIFA
jgi:hypothetical protein